MCGDAHHSVERHSSSPSTSLCQEGCLVGTSGGIGGVGSGVGGRKSHGVVVRMFLGALLTRLGQRGRPTKTKRSSRSSLPPSISLNTLPPSHTALNRKNSLSLLVTNVSQSCEWHLGVSRLRGVSVLMLRVVTADGFRGQDREMYARVFRCFREDPFLTALISIFSVHSLRSGGSVPSTVRSLELRPLLPWSPAPNKTLIARYTRCLP